MEGTAAHRDPAPGRTWLGPCHSERTTAVQGARRRSPSWPGAKPELNSGALEMIHRSSFLQERSTERHRDAGRGEKTTAARAGSNRGGRGRACSLPTFGARHAG